MQRPRITEIQVPIDCNGCVQKIKKALNGINGICDIYIDFPQQKLTVIGWADPEKIIKAIKKVRKIATICSHIEAPEPNSQPLDTPPDGGAATPGTPPPPPQEPPNSEAPPPPPQEPPRDQPPPDNPPPQNPPPPETNPSTQATDTQPSQPENPPKPRDIEDVHVIYHHPPDHGYSHGYGPGQNHGYGGYGHCHPGPSHEPPPQSVYVTHSHSYNTYRSSPYITEYQDVRSPPRYTTNGRIDHDNMDPYQNGGDSMFSDENPNACTIV